jgi:archaellin
MPQLAPYGINGTVTIGGSAQQGVRVWVQNLTTTYNFDFVENITYYLTDASGKYLIDLANLQTTISNGDVIRVFMEYGDTTGYSDHTVDTTKGGGTVNFSITELSGMTDGIGDNTTDGTGGLDTWQLKQGLLDGMQ